MHVLRAPLGGLFRHVVDLTREQSARGHAVGMIADSLTGGARADDFFAELAPLLTLGVSRVPMHRNPHVGDIAALVHVHRTVRAARADVVHGHGSKGAAYARLPAFLPHGAQAIRAYTPHGGSFNYRPGSAIHRIYMKIERLLASSTDVFLFESAYIGGRFEAYVGKTAALSRVVLNGISACEFIPVEPDAGAADFLYVGELRSAKGIDTLLDALAIVRKKTGISARAVLVGSGPDKAELTDQARQLGLARQISFAGPMPARRAFVLGRIMVVPSRAESLPYVVLEAAGAHVPLIATNVGGIPEIYGPHKARLIAPDNPAVLAENMLRMLSLTAAARAAEAAELADFVESRFSISHMADAVIDGYREAIARKHLGAQPAARAAAEVMG
jgi:glycosyltransferase involved in cell wall biosynthesis